MRHLLWLLTTVLLLFSHGRWAIAAIACIAPVLLVRYVRTRSIAGALVMLSIANFVWWRGVFPLPALAFAFAAILLGGITLVPYLLDRWLAPRLGPLAGTLVLPSAAVTIELLNSLFSPFGSWGSYAYTQAGVLPLMQLGSITGLAGITFLLLWFATAVHSRQPRVMLAYAIVAGAALVFGAVRVQAPAASDVVRVAAITPRLPTYTVRGDAANQAVHAALSSVRRRTALPHPQWEAFRRRAASINEEMLAATANAARQGARLVVWSEGAGVVETQDEPALLARAAVVARNTGAWIELSYLGLNRRGSATFENKNVLIDASGRQVWTYQKTHPVPGMEACVPGEGRVPLATTPFGRVATVICYDADFPRLVRQAAGADILLVPADDWREIAPMHASMARFRAVEQGLSIVRATSSGHSTVIDRYGRVRTSRDYFSGSRTMIADVPRRGAPTVYTHIGDAFAWSCLAVFSVLLVRSARFAPHLSPLPA